jgi:anthranilate synthase component II
VKVVILDNYDSFVYSLAHLVAMHTGELPTVVRSNALTLPELAALNPAAIVLSPGPGHPADTATFGICTEAILQLAQRVPTLGVCLGHQGIAHAFGGAVIRAREPRHGKTSCMVHTKSEIYDGLPEQLEVMRYHSLVVDPSTLPTCLRATGFSADGTLMSLEHVTWPLFGVQFHPESVATACGFAIMSNFLELAKRHTL